MVTMEPAFKAKIVDTCGTHQLPVVLFNCCKHELYTPNQGYKQMMKRLRGSYQAIENKNEVSLECLQGSKVVVFGCPRHKFTIDEVIVIKKYIAKGGSMLFLGSEGGDVQQNTNTNMILEEFGVSINSDCLVQPIQDKYFHPKEVLISDGILCREIKELAENGSKHNFRSETTKLLNWKECNSDSEEILDEVNMHIVYPYGATLSVRNPATAILSSGVLAIPIHCPLGALFQSEINQGRVAIIGSSTMFKDGWLEKEHNAKFMDFIFLWLIQQAEIEVNSSLMDEVEIGDALCIPNTQALANRVRCCLQEAEDLPRDFSKLLDEKLFEYHTNLIPSVESLYKQLGVKHAPLTLVTPQFEVPMPPSRPAVFPPLLCEPPSPALDLFDLDDCFASPSARLEQLTNKCKSAGKEDLQFYIVEAASILGVTPKVVGVAENSRCAAKALLAFICHELVDMKRPNMDLDL